MTIFANYYNVVECFPKNLRRCLNDQHTALYKKFPFIFYLLLILLNHQSASLPFWSFQSSSSCLYFLRHHPTSFIQCFRARIWFRV